jgi:hypothetical protein
MVSKDFVPGKPGRGVPAAHGRGGASRRRSVRSSNKHSTFQSILTNSRSGKLILSGC